jgi:hypothetical protein
VRRSASVIVLAAGFGATDQYLGSRGFVLGPWATQASLLSAPWLLVAFAAGWSQPRTRPAIVLGLAATFAALAGYWAMTLSPVEGAAVTARGVRGLLMSQSALIAGGLVTGPLFGWLGHRWRVHRDSRSALAAALAVCCEPLAHAADGASVGFGGVWAAEVAAGLALVAYVAVASGRTATGRRRS